MRLGGVDQPAHLRLCANEARLFAEAMTERFRQRADADGFGATDVERLRWCRAMRERLQDHVVRVALPNDVGVPGCDVDLLSAENFLSDIMQDTISHIDRVVQPDEAPRGAVQTREIFEHPLTSHA